MAVCDEIEMELSAFLDGELTASEKAAVEQHLASCPACTQALNALRAVAVAVADVPHAKAPAALMQKVRKDIADEPALRERVKADMLLLSQPAPLASRRKSYWASMVFGMAALVLLFLLAFVILPAVTKQNESLETAAVSEPRVGADTSVSSGTRELNPAADESVAEHLAQNDGLESKLQKSADARTGGVELKDNDLGLAEAPVAKAKPALRQEQTRLKAVAENVAPAPTAAAQAPVQSPRPDGAPRQREQGEKLEKEVAGAGADTTRQRRALSSEELMRSRGSDPEASRRASEERKKVAGPQEQNAAVETVEKQRAKSEVDAVNRADRPLTLQGKAEHTEAASTKANSADGKDSEKRSGQPNGTGGFASKGAPAPASPPSPQPKRDAAEALTEAPRTAAFGAAPFGGKDAGGGGAQTRTATLNEGKPQRKQNSTDRAADDAAPPALAATLAPAGEPVIVVRTKNLERTLSELKELIESSGGRFEMTPSKPGATREPSPAKKAAETQSAQSAVREVAAITSVASKDALLARLRALQIRNAAEPTVALAEERLEAAKEAGAKEKATARKPEESIGAPRDKAASVATAPAKKPGAAAPKATGGLARDPASPPAIVAPASEAPPEARIQIRIEVIP